MADCKTILFLADGMGDEPIEALDGKTPLEAVDTPGMDEIAAKGAQKTDNFILEDLGVILKHIEASTMGHDSEDDFEAVGRTRAAGRSGRGGEEENTWDRAGPLPAPATRNRAKPAWSSTGRVRVMRRCGKTGASPTVTSALLSSSADEPGNSDAVCPSEPMPSMTRSKCGQSKSPNPNLRVISAS